MKPLVSFAERVRQAKTQVWTEQEIRIVRASRKLWALEDGTHTPLWLLDWIHYIAWYEYLFGEHETRERIRYDLARTGRRHAGGS